MKRSIILRATVAVASLAALAGCGGGTDPQTVIDAVRATEHSQLQSLAADDLVGIVRLYADDAVLVRPDGSHLEGGAAIAEEYGDLVEDPNFALEIEPVDGWASSSDDLAVLTSHVDFTTTDAETGEAVTMPMFSQTVWTRQAGGTWMIVSAFNSSRVTASAQTETESATAQ